MRRRSCTVCVQRRRLPSSTGWLRCQSASTLLSRPRQLVAERATAGAAPGHLREGSSRGVAVVGSGVKHSKLWRHSGCFQRPRHVSLIVKEAGHATGGPCLPPPRHPTLRLGAARNNPPIPARWQAALQPCSAHLHWSGGRPCPERLRPNRRHAPRGAPPAEPPGWNCRAG